MFFAPSSPRLRKRSTLPRGRLARQAKPRHGSDTESHFLRRCPENGRCSRSIQRLQAELKSAWHREATVYEINRRTSAATIPATAPHSAFLVSTPTAVPNDVQQIKNQDGPSPDIGFENAFPPDQAAKDSKVVAAKSRLRLN
jgi:hypothetical protein